jgi:hypothetical protein
MADPNDPAEISFAQVVQLTDAASPAAAEYLAQMAGGVFLPLPRAQLGDRRADRAGDARGRARRRPSWSRRWTTGCRRPRRPRR